MIAYLDNAATTPVSPEAAQAACNAMTLLGAALFTAVTTKALRFYYMRKF